MDHPTLKCIFWGTRGLKYINKYISGIRPPQKKYINLGLNLCISGVGVGEMYF